MHIITQFAIITILLVSSTVSAAKKKALPLTPLELTRASKTYQRELQKAQQEQAQFAWQIGQTLPLYPTFFTTSFPQTRNDLAYRIWNAQQRPLPLRLKNLGYICSFNALTQVLWRLAPLNFALIRSKKEERTPLIEAYLESIATKNAAPRTSEASMDVKNLIDILNAIYQKKIGDETKQLADPFEIWQLFTEQCPGNVQELFNIATQESVYCPTPQHEKNIHIIPYPYVSIPVVSQQPNNLQDMLNDALNKGITEQVGIQCTAVAGNKKLCGLQKYKTSKVYDYPPTILVIHTGRSTGAKQDNKTPLLQDPIVFPLQGLTFGNQRYDLFGVVFHSGENAEDGHYYSWIRQQNSWYYCSDEAIQKIDNPAGIQSHKETFVFFYLRKKDDNTP